MQSLLESFMDSSGVFFDDLFNCLAMVEGGGLSGAGCV